MVVSGAAVLAGADGLTALRLGASMVALQASIGALNDLVDAPADRGRKPGKPIPAGLVGVRTARAVVVLAAGQGVLLAAPGGVGGVGLALAVLAIGYGYDLRAKGTAWSWLPFALGIPLLPVIGWYGATAGLARWFAALLPMAAVAGAALAVANARADLERDAAAGTATVATILGPERSWRVLLGLWALAGSIALGSVVVVGSPALLIGAVGIGVAVIFGGAVLGRRGDPSRRERAWEIQAVGAAAAAVAWIAAIV